MRFSDIGLARAQCGIFRDDRRLMQVPAVAWAPPSPAANRRLYTET